MLLVVQGRVKMSLHGPQGEVNGALLEDGTVLRLPPLQDDRVSALLRPGQSLVAQGIRMSNAMGRVLEVQQIGASRSQLVLLAPPPVGPGLAPPPPAGPGLAPPAPGVAPPPPRP